MISLAIACGKSSDADTETPNPNNGGGSTGCGTYNGKTLYKGAGGGCYYFNSNGNKTYVDLSKYHC
ncbi:hypothetical protein [Paraflavitalea speifideaquila]|uniref:hypothetical protein n=1 Tax=Paraflavitalea speifideaquila TaxID=3076558 RepID=UPI0028E620D7|nr:hypothetical protein [Paraflavitalea speifideiaquila]